MVNYHYCAMRFFYKLVENVIHVSSVLGFSVVEGRSTDRWELYVDRLGDGTSRYFVHNSVNRREESLKKKCMGVNKLALRHSPRRGIQGADFFWHTSEEWMPP